MKIIVLSGQWCRVKENKHVQLLCGLFHVKKSEDDANLFKDSNKELSFTLNIHIRDHCYVEDVNDEEQSIIHR